MNPRHGWTGGSRLRRTARALIRTALWAKVGSGNAVYCGNAGYLLAGAPFPVLRVRLTARMEGRVDEACRRLALTAKEAANLIRDSDKRHERWRREVSGRDCEPDCDVSFRFATYRHQRGGQPPLLLLSSGVLRAAPLVTPKKPWCRGWRFWNQPGNHDFVPP